MQVNTAAKDYANNFLTFQGKPVSVVKDQVDAVRTAHPDVEIFLYDGAGHAFANPDRPSYVAAAAALAGERSLAFLKKNLA